MSKICWSQHVKCVSVDTLTKNQVADFALVRTKHEFMMEIESSHCENSTKLEVSDIRLKEYFPSTNTFRAVLLGSLVYNINAPICVYIY